VATVTWKDVEYDAQSPAVRIRREMEAELAPREAALAT